MNTVTKEIFKETYKRKYNTVFAHKKLLNSSCVIFVYNSTKSTAIDTLHKSECVFDDEVALIEDSFHAFPNLKLISYNDEQSFLDAALALKQHYKNVYVYSMAQNITGVGRRCLIPLVCEYYGFINISSNSRSSFLGGDKKLMFSLLNGKIKMPNRIFLDKIDKEAIIYIRKKSKDLILKPNSESASIGIEKIDNELPDSYVFDMVESSLSTYGTIILEEFIDGDEVECTVLPWQDGIYIGEPVKIIKDTDYLDYNTVASDSYGFEIYNNPSAEEIKRQTETAYSLLDFDSLARIDFIVKGGTAYLFDITPNPTISACSSANTAMHLIKDDDRAIYIALLLQKLLIPTLD